jgi:hypothetical protein
MTEKEQDEKLYQTLNAAISKLQRFSDNANKPYVEMRLAQGLDTKKVKRFLAKHNRKTFFHNFRLTLRRICYKISLSKRIPRQTKSAKT